MESLAQLEVLCESLYNARDSQERRNAEQMLQVFSTSAEYIPQCKSILDQSQNAYAQLLAASSLVRIFTVHTLNAQLRLDMRQYVLSYLASSGIGLQSFVTTTLIQLLGRVTKLGWFDSDTHREIVQDVMTFLQQPTAGHYFIGLKILTQVTQEMNQPSSGFSLIQQRKIAVNFRDNALLQIFQVSLEALRQLHGDASAEEKLKEQAASLVLRCLSYDFVGTSLDESSEDMGTIQVPSSWRPMIADPATVQLMLDVYAATTPRLSCTMLECLVRLASVRRSLFTVESERENFISHLINGTCDILVSQQGLQEHENYHEFCRLLGRLKSNYHLSELVSVKRYVEWIQLVAEFTIKSLQSWQWASSSIYYLLTLWSRLVSSVPYHNGDAPSLLETYVPRITETYITSRLESVRAVMQGNCQDDPLENDEQLQEQLDSLPHLCRFQYEQSSKLITLLLDPLLQRYGECAGVAAPGPDMSLLEGQLTWLVYIISNIIRGRINTTSQESQEHLDGELSLRVFQLIRVMDTGYHTARYGELSRQRLDLAVLNFCQNFRKVYVGENTMHQSKVYVRLKEQLGLHDHLMVLNYTVTKINTNLKCFAKSEKVVDASLNLLQDLAAGIMSGKLLLKLESINFMLGNHTMEQFPFLGEQCNMRNRTIFYHTLGRLLFMDDSASKFKVFMQPFEVLCTALEQQMLDHNTFRSEACKQALIGLFRDLRGITMATHIRRTYGQLFEWIYPAHVGLMLRTVEVWYDSPEVMVPLLKFMSEFVYNKSNRLSFDSSSVNGILLFREVSKLIVAYGSRLLAAGTPSDLYKYKYKGIWCSMQILTRALSGNYVNFGVFELYGDPALNDALDMALGMTVAVPLNDILSYRKVAKSYFALIEVLCHHHMRKVACCDQATFSRIIEALETGLKALDVSVSTQCAASIDLIAQFLFNNTPITEASNPAARSIAQHFAAMPNLAPEILRSLFEIVLFEDCTNQWSLSRPMLSLILVNEQIFHEIKAHIISQVAPERQQRLDQCFSKLMTDVTRSLDVKNRDRFTQALTLFRNEFSQR